MCLKNKENFFRIENRTKNQNTKLSVNKLIVIKLRKFIEIIKVEGKKFKPTIAYSKQKLFV